MRRLSASAFPGAIGAALLSAVLFGITTPIAKPFLATASPWLVAGLLYAGSGIGVALVRIAQDGGWKPTGLVRSDLPWLGSATAAGGVVAPVLLMLGLRHYDAAATSLLLNLEVVFTALLAWLVFREPTGGRMVFGLLLIFAGGLVLAWPAGRLNGPSWGALLAVAGACMGWAIDNNLTRKISAADARAIAAVKGLIAGGTNIVLALVLGAALPAPTAIGGALLLGFLGYGVSLVLFIVALRNLGTARTSAYFATAPFIGAALSIAVYGQPGGLPFWISAACMGAGVWLHLTEEHAHDHLHEPLTHAHVHIHDAHHHHVHVGIDASEPHTHEHRHEPLRHSHPHFPDIHHQHRHPH